MNNYDDLPWVKLSKLPAEPGWKQWQGVPGHAMQYVERWGVEDVTIWVLGDGLTPYQVPATPNQLWAYNDSPAPTEVRRFTHDTTPNGRGRDFELVDYSLNSNRLERLCAHTKEDLLKRAQALLKPEIKTVRLAYQKLLTKSRTLKAHATTTP